MCASHPTAELQYVLDDSEAKAIVVCLESARLTEDQKQSWEELLRNVKIPVVKIDSNGFPKSENAAHLLSPSNISLPYTTFDDPSNTAMLLYTSGTTGMVSFEHIRLIVAKGSPKE